MPPQQQNAVPYQYTGILHEADWPVGNSLFGPLDGRCFRCVMTMEYRLSCPVVHITTNKHAIGDEDIFDLVHFLETCFRAERPICFLHDLRHLSAVSSRKQVSALFGYVSRNKKHMDAHLKCTAIVINSSLIRTLVNWLIMLFRPAQPTSLFADVDEATSFLRKHMSVEGDV